MCNCCRVAMSVWMQPLHATTPGHFSHLPPPSCHCLCSCTPDALIMPLPVTMRPMTRLRARAVLAQHLCVWLLHKVFLTGQSWIKHMGSASLSRLVKILTMPHWSDTYHTVGRSQRLYAALQLLCMCVYLVAKGPCVYMCRGRARAQTFQSSSTRCLA